MLLYKQKKVQAAKGNRFLISITVLGSAGSLHFAVNEEELVAAAVIDTALKSYAREGRLLVLGSNLNNFLLYCSNARSRGPGTRSEGMEYNLMLCKKQQMEKTSENGRLDNAIARRGSGSRRWKAWFNKSLMFKIPSH